MIPDLPRGGPTPVADICHHITRHLPNGDPMTRPTIHVADWGEFHATRHRAQEIAIAIVAAGATIVDFTGVQAVAGGFADELRTHLPEGAELVGMNAEVAETFADVTSRRGQQAPS